VIDIKVIQTICEKCYCSVSEVMRFDTDTNDPATQIINYMEKHLAWHKSMETRGLIQ